MHEIAPSLQLSLIVAHLNHGARGAASDADAAFVADLARALGLPCEIGHWKPTRAAHFETDARNARYAWLAEVAERQAAPLVAVGHTSDDQAETILQRILRGTGVRGLAGMPASRLLTGRVRLIRPLLDHSRDALLAFLRDRNQPYREDPTNADPAYTRSRIRQELIPLLQSNYNPRVVDALLRLGALAGATDSALQERLESAMRPILADGETGEIAFRAARLAALPPLLRAEALRGIWRCLGWPQRDMTRDHWRRLARLAAARDPRPARIHLPGAIEARRQGPRLYLRRSLADPPEPPPAWPPLPVPIPGRVQGPFGTLWLSLSDDPADTPANEWIDAEAIEPFLDSESRPTLLLGPPQPGDRFAPLGMNGQSKPLTDFLRERRVRPEDRRAVPILRDQKGIIWVIGHRIADRVKRIENTSRHLGLHFESPT